MVDHDGGPSPEELMRHEALQYTQLTERVVVEAAEVVSGVEGSDPQVLFPLPNEVRENDPGFVLSDDQETKLRELASELGFGRETDKTPEMAGLPRIGYVALLEGGQPHKVEAERRIVAETAGALIFCGSSRGITAEGERNSAKNVLSKLYELPEGEDQRLEIGGTEYEVVRQIAEAQPGFVRAQQDEDLGYMYDIHAQNLVLPAAEGQFKVIGHIANQAGDETPVVLMRIDREDYVDEEGNNKFRKQPDAAAVMRITADVLRFAEIVDAPLAFVTSSSYEPSRKIDGYRAGITTGHQIEVVAYGTATLADVKGESTPAPGPINQLPGELRKAYDQAQKLREEISS